MSEVKNNIPSAPDELPEYAAAVWGSVVSFLVREGRWKRVGTEPLKAYCWDAYYVDQADKLIHEEGVIVRDARGGTKKHEGFQIKNQAMSRMIEFSKLYGFDPKSRVSIGIKENSTGIKPKRVSMRGEKTGS